MKAKHALQTWFHRTNVTQYIRRRNKHVIHEFRKTLKKKLFNAWYWTLYNEKRKMQLMKKCVNRMQFLDVHSFFLHWAHYTISGRERERESKAHSTRSMTSILQKLFDRRKALALHQLKLRAFKKDFKYHFALRVFKHASSYRLRHYFQKWRQFNALEGIAETVNTEGDVVLARNDALR